MSLPSEHRAKLHSTNQLERLHGKIKRRTNVVGIFPNEDAITRLIGAILVEQNDEWAIQRARYMTLESITPTLPAKTAETLTAPAISVEGGEVSRTLMSKIRSIVAAQSSVREPEHRGDERIEAACCGGSPTFEPDVVSVVHDSRSSRRATPFGALRPPTLWTSLRYGQKPAGAHLRAGTTTAGTRVLCFLHLGTWLQQREARLMPKTHGRKPTTLDPQLKKLRAGEHIGRRRDCAGRNGLLAFREEVSELLRDPPETFRERRGRLMIAGGRRDAHTGCRTGESGVRPLAGLAVLKQRNAAVARTSPAPPRALDQIETSERLRSAPHALHRSGAGAGARHVAR